MCLTQLGHGFKGRVNQQAHLSACEEDGQGADTWVTVRGGLGESGQLRGSQTGHSSYLGDSVSSPSRVGGSQRTIMRSHTVKIIST